MQQKFHSARWHVGLVMLAVGTVIVGFFALTWLRAGGIDPRILSLTPEDVQTYAEAWAPWSAVASIGLMVLHSFLPLPAEIIAVANGMMFGLVGGVLITWAGAMLGAILSFAIARRFGRPALRLLVSPRRWRAIERWEFRPASLLLARLIPVISFNLINYGAGLACVGWWPFLWTTGVGILPLTVASVLLGNTILQASWAITGIIIACGALLWFALRQWQMQRIMNDLFVQASDQTGSECSGTRTQAPRIIEE